MSIKYSDIRNIYGSKKTGLKETRAGRFIIAALPVIAVGMAIIIYLY